jgi:hypothetical protein
MVINKFYVVTRKSKDGTFRKGDLIKLLPNGDILCRQARGWIDAEFVAEATKGMECVLAIQEILHEHLQ